MKLTKETLKRIIKEELNKVMNEDSYEQEYFDVAQGKFNKGVVARKREIEQFAKQQARKQAGQNAARAMKLEQELQDNIAAAIMRTIRDNLDVNDVIEAYRFDDDTAKFVIDQVESELNQRSASSRQAQADVTNTKEGSFIKSRVVPWMIKNSKSIWKKSGANSQEEFISNIKALNSKEPLELYAGKQQIINIIGQDMYDSIIKGRSFGQKLGRFFSDGSFSQ
jgi:hypothetical protein